MRYLWWLVVLVGCERSATTSTVTPPSNSTPGASRGAPARALVVVVDRSGSMTGARMDAVRGAMLSVVRALPRDAEVGVIAFDVEPTVVVELGVAGRPAVEDGIGAMQAGGGTQFYPALEEARRMLSASWSSRRHVVFVSDGQAPDDGVVEAARRLQAAGNTVSAIALGPDADRALLGDIAQAGGGVLYEVADVAALEAVLRQDVGP